MEDNRPILALSYKAYEARNLANFFVQVYLSKKDFMPMLKKEKNFVG
jgi:hypothetical protein